MVWGSEYTAKFVPNEGGSNAYNVQSFGHQSSRSDLHVQAQHQQPPIHNDVANALVWSTTHDRTYPPTDSLRPYSQHLLRHKTTSGYTAPNLHGSVASGSHVLMVGSRAVTGGMAPSEGFYPVRRSNGGREMLEVRYVGGGADAAQHVQKLPPVQSLSQSHPPQVNLLRHMTIFDLGPDNNDYGIGASYDASQPTPREYGQVGDTGLTARTERAAMVAGFAKLTPALRNSGMHSTSRHYHKDPFLDGAQLDATVDHMRQERNNLERRQKGNHKSRTQPLIPAGLGDQNVEFVLQNEGRITMPRCFKVGMGAMIEDEQMTGMLRTGKIKVPMGPRAKRTNADKLMYPPKGIN